MNRAVLAAVLAILALAAPARADVIPLRHDRDATSIALAGPDVIVLSEQGTKKGVKIVAVPRTGGKARTLLKVLGAGYSFDEDRLAASPQRVAAIVEIDGTKTTATEYRVYSGPPSGPLAPVLRTPDPHGDAFVPLIVSVDGDRLLVVEAKDTASENDDEEDSPGEVRARILDPAAGWVAIPWATGVKAPVAIAGSYAAVSASNPQRFALADLATGAELATLTGKWFEHPFVDVSADGRIAAALQTGIETASAGQPQRNLANSGRLTFPRFAGASIAAFDDAAATLTLTGPDGARQVLGPPSFIRTDLDADDAGVAWLFNGCLRYAPLGTPAPAPATQKNPCPTSEVALYTIGPRSKLRGDAARVPVKCVTSVSGRCRGRLVVRLDYGTPIVARGTFDIAVGDRWVKVPVHFNRATVAKFRRGHGTSALVNAIMRDGTVGSGADYSSEFGIEVDA